MTVISYIDIAAANIFPTIRLTTYGAPKVGNKEWAKHFDQITSTKLRRYIVNADPIVNMPACLTLLCSYKQVGVKINCYEDKAECIKEADEPETVLDQIKKITSISRQILKTRDIKSISDHTEGYPKIYNFTLVY